MQGPVWKKPDAALTASKLPEPLRKPVGAALQGLIDLTGADSPESMLPGPQISIYKDAAGIPSRALRELATTKTMEDIQKLPNNLRGTWEYFVKEYPRIAAHLKPIYIPKKYGPDKATQEATAYTYPLREGKRATVAYTKKGAERQGVKVIDTAFHEGTHVAQSLGNKDFEDLYRLSTEAEGYTMNPFEQAARASGGTRAGYNPPLGKTAIQLLQEVAQKSSNNIHRNEAAFQIQQILAKRAAGGQK